MNITSSAIAAVSPPSPPDQSVSADIVSTTGDGMQNHVEVQSTDAYDVASQQQTFSASNARAITDD